MAFLPNLSEKYCYQCMAILPTIKKEVGIVCSRCGYVFSDETPNTEVGKESK